MSHGEDRGREIGRRRNQDGYQAAVKDDLWADAVENHRSGRVARAIAIYQQLIAAGHGSTSDVWVNLGAALRSQGHFSASVACYGRAIEINPHDAICLSNLGNVLKDLGRFEEATAAHAEAVRLSPKNASFHHNYGIALRESGDMAAAISAIETACALEPGLAGAQWDRGQILLYLGRFEEAWEAFEWRWQIGEIKKIRSSKPEWNGEPFVGKTLLVYPEQGFGDTILSSRFLPLVKQFGGRVVLQCKRPLLRLFAGLEGVDELLPFGQKFEEYDLHIPMMSLPRIFRATPANIPKPPKLHVPNSAKVRVAPLVEKARDRFKVGIVWSGSVTFKGNARRAAPLDHFLRLAEIPGVQLYSLQKGEPAKDLDDTGARGIVFDAGSQLRDFAETAALIEELDLVLMTDSAVAHLTGSLCRPVWNLLCHVPYWLYQTGREMTPWYPSMKLFRQPTHGDWNSVFELVRRELKASARRYRRGFDPLHSKVA